MIVHLYAQIWNDSWMLPFFFRHYDSIVDKYILYDDGSTDDSLRIIQDHPNAEVARFPRSSSNSFVLSEQDFSNECWKKSRSAADWVIVTDIDEHLFHPDGRRYLARCARNGITMVPALGFQMISERVPGPDETLLHACPMGAPWQRMMKASIFNPDAIDEIGFGMGRHIAKPAGQVRVPETDEMLLFHFKYIGFERTHRRHLHLRDGLGSGDLERGWGHKYSWTEDQLREDWSDVSANAIDTARCRGELARRYPIAPWWQKYR